MKLRSKLALVSALTAALFAPALAPIANAEIATGQVTIVSAQTCGLAFVSGNPINYGSLSIGQVSLDQSLRIDNTGTASGSVTVSGGNWVSGATNVIGVGATQYAVNVAPGTVPYGSAPKVSLSTVAASLGTITPSTDMNMVWQLRADLIAGQTGFTGAATQTITFTSACP